MRRLLPISLVVTLAATGSAQASFPGQNGRIAFTEDHTIYTIAADGTGPQTLLAPPPRRNVVAWSPDGTKIAYSRGVPGQQPNLAVANADGSGEAVVVSTAAAAPAWSPDGTRIAFSAPQQTTGFHEIFVVDAAGGAPTQLTFDSNSRDPSWSPDGTRIAFVRQSRPPTGMGDFPQDDIWTMNADGTDVVNLTNTDQVLDAAPDWSPDGSRIVYYRWDPDQLVLLDPDSGDESVLLDSYGVYPDWSPDGTRVLYLDIDGNLRTVNADGTNVVLIRAPDSTFATYPYPDWQPIPYPGYARPKGATPVRVPLVPAFTQCSAPNREHGPPLAFGSCAPPTPGSDALTVGSAPANMSGSVRYATIVGNPSTPEDEADVSLRVEITDVRVRATGDDYSGEVEAEATTRLTDRTGSGGDPATATDVRFPVTTSCVPTVEATIGATCSLTTTLDTLIPGAVVEKQRTIMQLGQIRVVDGGPDGDTATEPNAVFLTQGLFVP